MLSKEQVEILTDKYITSLYDDLEREVIGDIARRVNKMKRFTETAELMAQAMREQGYSTAKIQAAVHKALNADKEYQKALAENTREYKQEIKKIIEETEEAAYKRGDMLVATAGDMSWNDDMQMWKKHNIDLKKPNSLDQLYKGIAKQTGDELVNISQSTGFKGTALGTTGVLNAYQRTMDLAMIKVSTGAFSYQQAVKDCVGMLAASGLRSIDYASGRSYQLDTAARMCIRTGANQLSGKIQEINLQQSDTPLVYVDAHAGSRPEHAVWQGQVYAYNPDGILRDGSKAGEKYDDFFHATDYGSVTGLMGANCAHHFYPYWEGDPIPDYKEPDPIEYNGKEYTYYEATQEMRRQERAIRQTKREMEAMQSLGEDTTLLKKKLRQQSIEYYNFSKNADINQRKYVLDVMKGTSKGAVSDKNYAKSIVDLVTSVKNRSGQEKFNVDRILEGVRQSEVGRESIEYIEQNETAVFFDNMAYSEGVRGGSGNNYIRLYLRQIDSEIVAEQTFVHEAAHLRFNIGDCQHAEAICYAYEKMHKENRTVLYEDEWKKLVLLAKEQYWYYNWEKGGYGDYGQFSFVRKRSSGK